MNQDTSAIRKAAILINCLDQAAADSLLDHMDPEQARRVRQAIFQLDDVPEQEQNQVIQEFMRTNPLAPRKNPAGIELDGALMRWSPPRIENASDASPASDDAGPPFQFLHEADGGQLAAFLQQERPQTIAVVLSYLPPERSAAVLNALPDELQAAVVRRLSELTHAAPEVVRDVEQALEARFPGAADSTRHGQNGQQAMTGILNAADPKLAERVRAILDQHQKPAVAPNPPPAVASPSIASLSPARPPTASAPAIMARPQLEFADVERLGAAAVSTVFQSASHDVATLALVGASTSFVDQLLVAMPKRQAKAFRKSMDRLGPTRLSDVDQAQQQIANLAEQLLGEPQKEPRAA